MENLTKLENTLIISFRSKSLLQQAFVHRSYLNENRDLHLEHNERLEFLGDAVLELVVTEHLYREYPDRTEGELTAWRAALVNSKRLSSIGRELHFNTYLMLSRGEAKEEGKQDKLFVDSKSRFQELAQEKEGITPTYIVLKEWGPDHAKHFRIGVYLEKELAAEGEGSSKQEAEQEAAKNALTEKNWE
ncbi:MAG: Rnc [Parcubacteria group bacterium GW2011_GWA2_50_10]|nr:MAG: Rnc [Parcubacteria group bacterium GW2011_GWA2_50_10]